MDLQPNKSDAVLLPITNTRISASEWNQLVGSCMAFIYAAGFSPDAADNEQFLNAFKKIASELELVGANTALSNLTSEGQGKFDAKANVSLDNLSSAGSIVAAKASMPSGTYDSLTMPANGGTVTAPSDGYFWLGGITDNVSAITRIVMRRTTDRFGVSFGSHNVSLTGGWTGGVLPVKKGDTIAIFYDNITADHSLRFYYAAGSTSEKAN